MCGMSLDVLYYVIALWWIASTEISHILRWSCSFVWVCVAIWWTLCIVYLFPSEWKPLVGYAYLNKGSFEWVWPWWVSYIRAVYHVCGTPFQILGNVSGIRDLFMRLGLAVLRKKTFARFASSYVCDRKLGFLLEWRHSNLIPYITICTFVTIFNWRHKILSIDKRSTCSLSLTHVSYYTYIYIYVLHKLSHFNS